MPEREWALLSLSGGQAPEVQRIARQFAGPYWRFRDAPVGRFRIAVDSDRVDEMVAAFRDLRIPAMVLDRRPL